MSYNSKYAILYRKKHKKKLSNYFKGWYKQNLEKQRAYVIKYNREHKDKICEYQKKYEERNKGKIKKQQAKYYKERLKLKRKEKELHEKPKKFMVSMVE